MKPRNKFQRRVYDLSCQLPKLSAEQKDWAKRACLKHIGYRRKDGYTYCLDCGHDWKGSLDAKTCNCPKCGTKLKLETTRKLNLDQKHIRFAIIDVREEFQIVRIFEIFSYHKTGEKRNIWMQEIIQQFIIPGGKHQFVARQRNRSWYADNFYGYMEIRDSSNWNDKYTPGLDYVYPKMKVLPVYRRNGFKTGTFGVAPFPIFKKLYDDSYLETLLKAKQYSLFRERAIGNNSYKISQYWASIKICIRNNYRVPDASIWFDHLELLRQANKDLRSPKYVCPPDLIKTHNKMVAKRERERRRMELERKKRDIEEAEKLYKEQKAAFLGLVFTDANITVKMLESVQEFIEEGEKHKHCVFGNSYYRRKDSLIFSARVGKKPVETVEFSLSEMRVVQSRGLQNQPSEYNKQILKVVGKNIPKIRRIYEKVKETG